MFGEFIALDVETANPNLASICQIGLVSFAEGRVVRSWQSLVNPEDYFSGVNVLIHGIDESSVRDAPVFPDLATPLRDLLHGKVVVTHMPFDKVALRRVSKKYGLPQLECTWLDTARVCRRAWTQFARRGYNLEDMAEWCAIEFRHHDAEEDARAAGLILLRAIEETGSGVDEWVVRASQPISPSRITREGELDGPLAGEVVVFTGALSMTRREAADMAAALGCDVAASVTKKTTLLVVGEQDIRKLAGREKSAKHRRAEELIEKGVGIRILGEPDFLVLDS